MGETDTPGGDKSRTRRRLTVSEAADVLGVTIDAIRGRIRRGTIEVERQGERVYVLLDADKSHTERDKSTGQYGESDALTSQLRDEIAYLREENRRKDEIIMQQALTVRQLTAPSQESGQESRESPETPSEESTDTQPRTEETEPQTESSRPSWWRRWFGIE